MTEGLRRLDPVSANAQSIEALPADAHTAHGAPLERPARAARLAVIALLALVIAACGDGLNLPEADDGTGSVPPVEAPASDEPPSEAPPSDEPPSDEPPSEAPPSDEPPTEAPPADEPPTQQPGSDEPAGGESPSEEQPIEESPDEDSPPTASTTLRGYVIDGPVAGAEVTIRDASGREIATGRSDDRARFAIELGGDIDYPLSIQASGGINATTGEDPGFTLAGIVSSSSQTDVVVSALSSLVMQRAECDAQSRGDSVATSHLRVAEDIAAAADPLRGYGFGLTTAQRAELLTGSPATPAEAAGLLLASEAMAESLRRAAAASDTSVAETLWAVACALVDDKPEDATDIGTPQQVAAFHTARTVVQLETARGRLQVAERDTDVIGLLEDAVTATFEMEAGQTIEDLPLTEEFRTEMLRHANNALAAAPSTELLDLYERIFSLTGEESRGEINDRLESVAFTPRLEELLVEVAADASRASQMNDTATADNSELPPPSISFTASPRKLSARGTESTTLTYEAENATACVRSAEGFDDWSGTHGTRGEVKSGPINRLTTFSLRCTGPGGIVEESVEVTVPPEVQTAWTRESGDIATSFDLGEKVRLDITSRDTSGDDACEVRRSDTGDLVTGDLTADFNLSVSVSCEGPGGTSVVKQSVPVRAARLVWEAPTQRTDGSPLTSLSGFRIYHGTSSGNYDGGTITIGDPTRDSHTESFPSGPRYFTMIAIDPNGREGERAAEVFKQIP